MKVRNLLLLALCVCLTSCAARSSLRPSELEKLALSDYAYVYFSYQYAEQTPGITKYGLVVNPLSRDTSSKFYVPFNEKKKVQNFLYNMKPGQYKLTMHYTDSDGTGSYSSKDFQDITLEKGKVYYFGRMVILKVETSTMLPLGYGYAMLGLVDPADRKHWDFEIKDAFQEDGEYLNKTFPSLANLEIITNIKQ